MTESQSRHRNPASWQPAGPDQEGLWIFTRPRGVIGDIATTSPARPAPSLFAVVLLVLTFLLSLRRSQLYHYPEERPIIG
ncbi:MAG TPA: hypothetical protein VIM08_01915 [Arthrobacter sp.]|jgi:hypothetical protein